MATGKKTIRLSKANPTPRALSNRSLGKVIRSAHIGNTTAYNLAGTLGRVVSRGGRRRTTGIELQVYDRTTPAADKNYHPGRIIYGGKEIMLFENSERLTPFMFLSYEQRQAAAEFLGVRVSQIPENLATLHYRVLKRVAKGARVETFSQYLARKERPVQRILTHLAQKGCWEIFDRYVDKEGNVRKLIHVGKDDLTYAGGVHVKKKDAVEQTVLANRALARVVESGRRPTRDVGTLVSVKAVTLLAVALEAYGKKGPQSVYHASGPDMINYVLSEGYGKEFSRLVDAMEDFPHIPSTIDFKVFSLLPMQVMSPRSMEEQTRLTKRLAALMQRKRQIEKAKYALRHPDVDKKALIARTQPLERRVNADIERTAAALAPFIEAQDPTAKDNFYRRRWLYDHRFRNEGYEYELPDGLAERTIGELDNLLSQIKMKRKP